MKKLVVYFCIYKTKKITSIRIKIIKKIFKKYTVFSTYNCTNYIEFDNGFINSKSILLNANKEIIITNINILKNNKFITKYF